MIYQYDFFDSSQFLLDNLLKARDTMLRYNVPHETKVYIWEHSTINLFSRV
jgi:hypothetical protein